MNTVLNKSLNELADFLKEKGFGSDETIGICLLCKEERKAQKMLEYCKQQRELETSSLLEKAVEIYKE